MNLIEQDHTGDLRVPDWEKKMIGYGALAGAVIAGLLTFSIFSIVGNIVGAPKLDFMVAAATAIATVHGALLGPLVFLLYSKKQARRILVKVRLA